MCIFNQVVFQDVPLEFCPGQFHLQPSLWTSLCLSSTTCLTQPSNIPTQGIQNLLTSSLLLQTLFSDFLSLLKSKVTYYALQDPLWSVFRVITHIPISKTLSSRTYQIEPNGTTFSTLKIHSLSYLQGKSGRSRPLGPTPIWLIHSTLVHKRGC